MPALAHCGPLGTQRVVIMRHGERRDAAPNAPLEGDPPLTDRGKKDIECAAQKLRQVFGAVSARRIALVVSPFARCVQTAEGLLAHGIGVDGPFLYDCSICEVYGPMRIKAPSVPVLPRHILEASVGLMPEWGESIASAHERFVESFVTIADRFVGAGGASDSFASEVIGSDLGATPLPAAVTNRTKSGHRSGGEVHSAHPGNANQNHSHSHNRGPTQPTALSPVRDPHREALDIVLVTHGDALSAVVSHFYPSRTVYETEYLSYVVMKRYSLRSRIFHVDDSAGVHWIIEGPDREPEDPAYALAHRSPSASGSEPDPDDILDDGDGEDNGGGVPHSSINRRSTRVPVSQVSNSRSRAVSSTAVQASGPIQQSTAAAPARQLPSLSATISGEGGSGASTADAASNRGNGVGSPRGAISSLSSLLTAPTASLTAVGAGRRGAGDAVIPPTVAHHRGRTVQVFQPNAGRLSFSGSTRNGIAAVGGPPEMGRAPVEAHGARVPVSTSQSRAKAAPSPLPPVADASGPGDGVVGDGPGGGGEGGVCALSAEETVRLLRVHPKAVEDCSRTRPPTGAPLQSSGHTQKDAVGVVAYAELADSDGNGDGCHGQPCFPRADGVPQPPTQPALARVTRHGSVPVAMKGKMAMSDGTGDVVFKPPANSSGTGLGVMDDYGATAKKSASAAAGATSTATAAEAPGSQVVSRAVRGVPVSAAMRTATTVSQLTAFVAWQRRADAGLYVSAVALTEAALALLLARATRTPVAHRWRRALEEFRWIELCRSAVNDDDVEAPIPAMANAAAGASQSERIACEGEPPPGPRRRDAGDMHPPALGAFDATHLTTPLSLQHPVVGASQRLVDVWDIAARHVAATLLRFVAVVALSLLLASAVGLRPIVMLGSLLTTCTTLGGALVHALFWAFNIARGVLDEQHMTGLQLLEPG